MFCKPSARENKHTKVRKRQLEIGRMRRRVVAYLLCCCASIRIMPCTCTGDYNNTEHANQYNMLTMRYTDDTGGRQGDQRKRTPHGAPVKPWIFRRFFFSSCLKSGDRRRGKVSSVECEGFKCVKGRVRSGAWSRGGAGAGRAHALLATRTLYAVSQVELQLLQYDYEYCRCCK